MRYLILLIEPFFDLLEDLGLLFELFELFDLDIGHLQQNDQKEPEACGEQREGNRREKRDFIKREKYKSHTEPQKGPEDSEQKADNNL